MSEIILGTYTEFKASMDQEMTKVADGVVKIGYLLKVARDTDVLANSGYKTVAEFAEAEYGMRKDAVSRYIAINDRYSVDGYSEELDAKYQGYGATKLSEMLTLPDTIVEDITPDFTKEDIRTIKKEIAEESKVSEMEVLLEEQPDFLKHDDGILQQVFREYGYENPSKFLEMRAAIKIGATAERIMDVIAPSGYGMITVRIPGKGKYMMTFKSKDVPVEMLNVRENVKEQQGWGDIISAVIKSMSIYADSDREAWEELYGEPWKSPVVASAQPEKPAQPEKKVTIEPSKKPKPAKKPEKKPEKPDTAKEDHKDTPKPEPDPEPQDIENEQPAAVMPEDTGTETIIINPDETIVEESSVKPDMEMSKEVVGRLLTAVDQAEDGNLIQVLELLKTLVIDLEHHLKME